MPNYRVLKSVAHNWAHSLLSDASFVEDTIMVQFLLDAARAAGESAIWINPLTGELRPEIVATDSVKKALSNVPAHFALALKSQGCSLDMVQRIELHIDFDLNKQNPKYNDIKAGVWYSNKIRMPEAPTYTAVVYMLDAHGHEYRKHLPEFWRY